LATPSIARSRKFVTRRPGSKTTEAAEAAGYKRVTDCVEHQPAGAMGYHFENKSLLDTTLDLDHPEVLVYEKKPDGAFKLNGVEFLVPISAWDGRRAAAHHGASPQEGRSPGHLVPPRLDVEAESERSVCRLEPQREVRGRLIDASLDRRFHGSKGRADVNHFSNHRNTSCMNSWHW
jgi:hypothetical protein